MLGLCAPTDPIPPATHAPGYSDPFCRQWMPMGPGCSLVKVAGRHGPTVCAVQLSKAATDADAEGASAWEYEHEGPGSWGPRWTARASFRATVYCKYSASAEAEAESEGKGKGAVLGLRWGVTNGPQTHPWVFSQRLSAGTAGWQQLSVQLSQPPKDEVASGCLMITLRQDGPGAAQFSEFSLVATGTSA